MFTVEGKGCVYWMHDGVVVTPLEHPEQRQNFYRRSIKQIMEQWCPNLEWSPNNSDKLI